MSNTKINPFFKISSIKPNPTINILNVGFNLRFDNQHLKFYCWIEFDIQYWTFKKNVCWTEFYIQYSTFKI